MQAVILAGGLGTRLAEETTVRPKPMVEIGTKPILWHIMNKYAKHGVTDFISCCGYKGYQIKEYFANYVYHNSDFTVELSSRELEIHTKSSEHWRVTMVDTGLMTNTGGRLKRISNHILGNTFFMTYGDGLSDVDINNSLAFHKKNGRLATVTAVRPTARYGSLVLSENNLVSGFKEKPPGDGAWISGGYFVLEKACLDLVVDDSTAWESEPLEVLARRSQLSYYKHTGFWHPMDTLRDKNYLESLWQSGSPPWI